MNRKKNPDWLGNLREENKKILCSFMGFYIGYMTKDTVWVLF